MSAQPTKSFSFTLPVLLVVLVGKMPHGFAQTSLTLAAAFLTMVFIPFGARLVWTPVFEKGGLRWATVLLVCSLLTGFVATIAASATKLGDPSGFSWYLASRCVIAGLLFSWGLAAVRGAQEKEPNQSQQPTTATGRG